MSFLFLASIISISAKADSINAPMVTSQKGMIVTCEPLAAQAGIEILRKGGSAAEAYITTTLAEYVTAYGYTSLSGPLYVLYYDSKSKKSSYLNAGLNTVQDPKGQWSEKERIPGTSYVIGGAGRGLEALFQRYKSSKFSLSDLAAPAVKLAGQGFPISTAYSRNIRKRLPVMGAASEWMSKFTRNGVPLQEGELLIQHDLAETLTRFGREGSDYLFKGKFAHDLIRFIQSQGGKLTLQDLASYQVYWNDPLEIRYRDFRVQSSSYRSFGGLELLLSLKTLENMRELKSHSHYSKDEKSFETILRTHLFSLNEVFAYSNFNQRLEATNEMKEVLNGPLPKKLWDKVNDPQVRAPMAKEAGTHSCNPVVIDKEGNIATGIHTVNSLMWGDYGFFVDGVSLNTAHAVVMDAPSGVRALDSISPLLVFKNDRPIVAAGFYSAGLSQAAFQLTVNLLDYGMSPKDALEAPRFGAITDYTHLAMLLDRRYPQSWVDDFAQKGILFSQPAGYAATGMGMVIRIDPETGLRSGSPTELVPSAVMSE